ncbi:DUF5133 domain-containing protein [Streptomyces sp. NPDC060194]|uniref:DUF5133 domain-containing protein n=1 Tax=Streptomyces sp. NPDC060194 TaxID=3347069 RepID=UPI00365C53C0
MLLPAKPEVMSRLERYRTWERTLLVAPCDRAVRGNFEDAGIGLRTLMGKRCAREAADAAERYLRPPAITRRHTPSPSLAYVRPGS